MLLTGRKWAGLRAGVLALAAMFTLPDAALAQDTLKGVTVTVVKATKTCFAATAEVFGVMLPMEEVSVTPPREGLRVSQVLVDPGATVTAGQALIRLTQPEGGEITLVAPVAGTVSNVSATVGTLASARADPLFRIIARGEFEMVGDVPGKDMPGLATGQVATIRVVGAPSVQGRVRSVSSTIDPITQVGQVRIQIITPAAAAAGQRLRPGHHQDRRKLQRCGSADRHPLWQRRRGDPGRAAAAGRDQAGRGRPDVRQARSRSRRD